VAFEKLRSTLIGLLSGGRDTIYDQRGSPHVPAWSNPPKRSTGEWLETYGRSPRLGVVTKIAEDLAFADGRLLRRGLDGEDEELPETHPFWTFWNNPNPMPQFTKEAIWQLHQIYLLLVGEAFMIIEKDMWGYPTELWPLPPHWVTGTPSTGNPFYTVRTASGFMAQVHMNDMFIQMELNPVDPYGRGLGKAQGIADEVEIDEYAAAFEKRFFYNDATPNSIIALEGADADAVDRFEAKWNRKHRGVVNSHKTAVTSGRVTAVKLADNMKDLDMTGGRIFLRDTVLEHFHMPREIMGITENSNRSTAEAAQYIYAQNVETPFLMKRKSAVNIQIVPYWGDELRFEYNEIIPRNQEFDKAVANDGWSGGYITMNEARAKVDMEPVENGDVMQAPLLFSYVKENQDLTAIGMSADGGGDYFDTFTEAEDPLTGSKQIKSSISRVDQRAIQLMERAQREQERHAENVTTQHFSRQRRDLLETLRGSGVAGKAAGDSGADFGKLQLQLESVTAPARRAEIVAGFVGQLTDWSQDEERVREILSNIWSKSYEQGQGIMQQLYNLKNPNRPDVRNIFNRMGGQKIAKDISGTTRNRICEIIDNGLRDGVGIDDLAEKIGASADLGKYRAHLIAQQETYNSLSAANFDAMQDGGTQRHKWVTRGDGDVRPSHKRMNGEVRQVGEPFSNGLLYPRDPNGSAEETMKCRCWTLPVRERPAKSTGPLRVARPRRAALGDCIQIKRQIGVGCARGRAGRKGGEAYAYTDKSENGNQAIPDAEL